MALMCKENYNVGGILLTLSNHHEWVMSNLGIFSIFRLCRANWGSPECSIWESTDCGTFCRFPDWTIQSADRADSKIACCIYSHRLIFFQTRTNFVQYSFQLRITTFFSSFTSRALSTKLARINCTRISSEWKLHIISPDRLFSSP